MHTSERRSTGWGAFALASTFVALVLGVSAGCGDDGGPDEPTPRPTATAIESTPEAGTAVRAPTPVRATPGTWLYRLSEVDPDRVAGFGPPVMVIDYSRDGTTAGAFTAEEVAGLRDRMPEPALVLSYLSIGEAEDYRYYWQEDWKSGEPSWLEAENPYWAGNFKVRYWEPGWQGLIFGSPDSYLDLILAAGFDGAYLDIIDAYEYFAEQGRETAADDTVAFVRALSEHAKAARPDFSILPQNAPELGARADYLAAVDGIGVEGVYFGYDAQDRATEPETTSELEGHLARFVDSGKLVLSVDYATSDANIAAAYRRAREQGFVPTVTDVELAGLPFPDPSP